MPLDPPASPPLPLETMSQERFDDSVSPMKAEVLAQIAKRQDAEAEATDWILVADGVKHHPRCADFDDKCLRCQLEEAEAARDEARADEKLSREMLARQCDLARQAETDLMAERQRRETAEARLPVEMPGCTILFKECYKGHGRLEAANWVGHGCPYCVIENIKQALLGST